MDNESQSLKDMIDLFLRDSAKIVRRVKRANSEPSEEEIAEISQRIWDLHHFALKLVSANPSESLYYNAKIIKDLVEEILLQPEISLLEAADAMKKASDKTPMKTVILQLAQEDKARTVLFGNLEEISQELAA